MALRLFLPWRGFPPGRRRLGVGRGARPAAAPARLEQAYDRLNAAYEGQRRFLADLSQQLRTPLTVIRGNVDLLRQMEGRREHGADGERDAMLADTWATSWTRWRGGVAAWLEGDASSSPHRRARRRFASGVAGTT